MVFRLLLLGVLGILVGLPGVAPGLAAQPSPAPDPLETRVLEVIRKHPEAILESLERYEQQKEQAQQAKQAALLRQLFPVANQIVGESPALGRKEDPLLVEFSDFQCPYCAQAHRELKALLAQEGTNLRLIYKHFPLSQIHPQALPAARAAWAAGRQGKFWAYHDALFRDQPKLGEALYPEIAKDLGLDLERFNRDRSGEASLRAIQQDLALAEQLALQGTPTFLLQRGNVLEVVPLQAVDGSPQQQAQSR